MYEHNTHLTSAEIASLWTAYMDDSMSQCILKVMLEHIEDVDIKPIVQSAYDMSVGHVEQLKRIFEMEDYAIPNGFNEQKDLLNNESWLFSDVFCILYVNNMTKLGLIAYSGALSMSFRKDLSQYFSHCLSETINLYNQANEVAIGKGISTRPPYMAVPDEIDYVDSKQYISGLNPFSEKRPLNAIEISYLYSNIMTNAIGANLCVAFSQTSPSEDVQKFMLRGNEIAKKHIQTFTSTLLKEDVHIPKAPNIEISNSTTQPFSDKLMMFHMSQIIAAGIGNYATASAASQRLDISAKYEKASLEAAGLAKSGADIMIKYNWLEQPPGIKDRKKLAREKK